MKELNDEQLVGEAEKHIASGPKVIKQKEFIKAFRNHFFNDDAVQRVIDVAKSGLGLKLVRPQAQRLFTAFWEEHKVRNKKAWREEITDEKIANWLINFVEEHKG